MNNATITSTASHTTLVVQARTVAGLTRRPLIILSSLLFAFDVIYSHAADNPLMESPSDTGAVPAQVGTDAMQQQALTHALRQRPDDANSHYQLGQLYEKSGQWEHAKKAYQTAIRLNPKWADAHYRLGIAYERLGTFESNGEIFTDKKSLHQAMAEYRRAVQIDPTHLDALYRLSLAYQTKGQFAFAIAQCQTMLQINPNHHLTRQLVQSLYEEYLADHP